MLSVCWVKTSLRRSRSWMYLSVCSNKTTSNNLTHVSHKQHDLNERASIEKKKNLFQLRALFGMKHNMHDFRSNNHYLLYKIRWHIILQYDYELLFLLLLAAWGFQWMGIKATLTFTPLTFLYFYYRILFILTFLTFTHYPIF